MKNDVISKIMRGTTEIISVDALQKKFKTSLAEKRRLRIKAGFDPTAPDLHLGHVVLLRKLRQFQDLGHHVFFLIGDFTAQIGDPSGRDQTRPKMNAQEIRQNASTYQAQVFKILDPQETEIVFNSHWLKPLSSQEIVELTAYSTVAQMLARADFKKRFEEKKEISIREFIYPLLQGYDSVHLQADIELGGSDQKFNLLMGRQLQEAFHQEPQAVILTPLLEGTDGVLKMSKSLGNTIGINESPDEIFGKIMSISDELMVRYYELLTDFDPKEIKSSHPKEAKLKLAETISGQFSSMAQAKKARENFEKTFSRRQNPDNVQEFPIQTTIQLSDIPLQTLSVSSHNELRRLIREGAITHDGFKINNENQKLKEGMLKIGKRRFLKLVAKVFKPET